MNLRNFKFQIQNKKLEKKRQRIKKEIVHLQISKNGARSVFSPRAEFPFSRLPSRRYPFSPNHVASSDVTARSYGISWNGPTLREYPYTRPARTYLLVYLRRRSATRCSTRTSQEFLFSLPSLSFSRLIPLLPSPSIRVSLRAAHWSGILKTINGSNPDSLPQSSIVISMHACDCSLIVCNVLDTLPRCWLVASHSNRERRGRRKGGIVERWLTVSSRDCFSCTNKLVAGLGVMRKSWANKGFVKGCLEAYLGRMVCIYRIQFKFLPWNQALENSILRFNWNVAYK